MDELERSESERRLLDETDTIAVVGLSPNESKASNVVAKYLEKQGYHIIPVNPGYDEILNKKSYNNLSEIPEKIDLVNIFRRPSEVQPIVEEAVKLDILGIWMQEGISHEPSKELAEQHKIPVVMDRCIMKKHKFLNSA